MCGFCQLLGRNMHEDDDNKKESFEDQLVNERAELTVRI
jgi:hypothetical protein